LADSAAGVGEGTGTGQGATGDGFSLAGRVAVVTGAAGLLGRRHCAALAAAGARVVATDLDGDACAAVVREMGGRGEGLPWAADITRPESVAALRDAVLERCGAIDVLVNNAALNEKVESPLAAGEVLRFENFPLALWEDSLRVNVTGTFLCCQLLGAEMARRGAGSIVNIASTYAMVAPDQSLYRQPDGTQTFFKSAAYPTTKGAVLALTRFLAAYWGGAGVRVNALSPGGVENGQDAGFVARYAARTPLGRMADPSDYEGALVFLASDASRYMTGANLVVDGGWTAW
jgi:NAD(P)-dependent dehydrogenase (short-subunit alcohol dehydrogenase family)